MRTVKDDIRILNDSAAPFGIFRIVKCGTLLGGNFVSGNLFFGHFWLLCMMFHGKLIIG